MPGVSLDVAFAGSLFVMLSLDVVPISVCVFEVALIDA